MRGLGGRTGDGHRLGRGKPASHHLPRLALSATERGRLEHWEREGQGRQQDQTGKGRRPHRVPAGGGPPPQEPHREEGDGQNQPAAYESAAEQVEQIEGTHECCSRLAASTQAASSLSSSFDNRVEGESRRVSTAFEDEPRKNVRTRCRRADSRIASAGTVGRYT